MKEFTVTDKNGEKRVETLLMTTQEFRALAEQQNLPYSSAILGSLSPIRYCKIEKYPSCLLGTMRVPSIEGRAAFAFGFYLQEQKCCLFPEAGGPEAKDSVRMPECNARMPECNARVPERNARMSECNARMPECNARMPECNARMPECNARMPECNVRVPECNARMSETNGQSVEGADEADAAADGNATLEAMIGKVLQSGGDMRTPVQFLLLIFETMIREEVFQLEALEDGLGAIENQLLEEIPESFDETIVSYQKKLTSLHTYYEQLMNVGDMMCSNLDNYLPESQRRFWEHFTARAERLHDHTETLREYLMQIRALYQAQIDAQQNRVVTMLTIITTIFLPLTLIAGWYGMNFPQMPEFGWKYAYLGVIIISALIVLLEILYFKKKKML